MDNNLITISSFPQDDEEYIIKNFGLIRKNPSPNASVYLVEVCMESLRTGKKLSTETILTHLLLVRIGSVWKNQKRIHEYYHKETAGFEVRDLSLSLRSSEKRLIKVLTRNQATGKKRVIDLENSVRNGNEVMSTFTVFETHDGLQIFIPSLEILLSAYTPETHSILHDIITLPIDDVVNKHLKDCIVGGKNNCVYSPVFVNNYAISTKFFLAYLSCNSATRKNVSKIRSSLSNNQTMRGKQQYSFLEVFPYHPDNFDIEVIGLYDKTKRRFWVHQIKKYSLPRHYLIDIQNQEKDEQDGTPRNIQRKINNDKTVEEDIPFIDDVDAGRNAGKKYIKSHVSVDIPWERVRKNDPATNEVTVLAGVVAHVEPEAVSASPLSGQKDSRPIARVDHRYSEDHNKKGHLESLLISIKDLQKDIYFLADDGDRKSEITFCSLPKKKTFKGGYSNWAAYTKNQQRKLLVCEICWEDKFVYILDIQRKNKEAYSGIIFSLKSNMDSALLKQIRETISINQGRFERVKKREFQGGQEGKRTKRMNFPVDHYKTFSHYTNEAKMRKYIHSLVVNI